MKYDDTSWHTLSENYPSHLPQDKAPLHMGIFLSWMFEERLASQHHLEAHGDAVIKVANNELAGGEFVDRYCGGKLTSGDFSEEGNEFAEYYYGDAYLKMFVDDPTISRSSSPYETSHFELTRSLISSSIRKAYAQWKNRPEKLDYSEIPEYVEWDLMPKSDRNSFYFKTLMPFSWDVRDTMAKEPLMDTEAILVAMKILGEENWTGDLHLLAEMSRYAMPLLNEEQVALMARLSCLSDNYMDSVAMMVEEAYILVPQKRDGARLEVPSVFQPGNLLYSDNEYQQKYGFDTLCRESVSEDEAVANAARVCLETYAERRDPGLYASLKLDDLRRKWAGSA